MDRDFADDHPYQKWTDSIGCIWASEVLLYLAAILDLHAARVIGWADNRLKRDLASRALQMAIVLRSPPRRYIFRGERGSQYCLHHYQRVLREHGLMASMSVKGNLYHNSSVKTFLKTITAGTIWRRFWEAKAPWPSTA